MDMQIDFSPISNLNLRNAFANIEIIRNISEDKNYLALLFEHSNRSVVFVFDDAEIGYSRYVNNTAGLSQDKTLVVDNSNHLDVFLMRIDGVLFPKQSKCDCALLVSRKMAFVEFKTNAANKTEESMEAQYEKCFNQLGVTIKTFENHYKEIGESFRDKLETIRAYAVFNPTVPHANSSQKLLSARFSKEYRIKLCFDNKIKIG